MNCGVLTLYKMLIVDDEASVRSGLRECVDWEQYGIEVTGEAEDGEEALALMEAVPVHIVITDVKMPHMDGIALASALRERNAGVKIVFISGFDDLDYIRSALKLDAIDYILKPVQLTELGEVFRKITGLLREEDVQQQELNRLNMKLNQSIPLLRERFLTTLVCDGVRMSDPLLEKFDFLGIRLNPEEGRYCVFVIRIDNFRDTMKSKSEKEKQLLSFALLNICQDIVNASLSGHTFEIAQGGFAGIINLTSDSEEEQLFTVLSECKEQLNKILKLNVTIGVGCTVSDMTQLPQSYRLASEAAEHKWYIGKNQVITIDSLQTINSEPDTVSLPDIRPFASILKSPEQQPVTDYISELFETLSLTRRYTIKHAQNTCIQLLLVCSNLLLELDLESEAISSNERALWETIHLVETIGELQAAMSSHVGLVHSVIADKRERRTKNVVVLIQKYIELHYAKDLTIADIAASVYLTTTYVCLLFKQETGMTINDYVIEVRMKEAIRLLGDPQNKLYDICYSVGYKDPGYFRKLFKKQTGYTLSEYRDTML
jgi:two-component system response regulator YesN